MRKYGAAALMVVLLMAAAFFLPEWLSELNDRQLLDNPSIQVQEMEQEGFAESVQLTVAEKVMLLRAGSFTAMELSHETVEGVAVASDGGTDIRISLFTSNTESAVLKDASEEEINSYNEEVIQLWNARMEAARQEVLNLQALGGLPMLWRDSDELSYTGYGELIYMDPDTRMNFQVYRIVLSHEPYTMSMVIDVQSVRILSFTLQWNWDKAPNWGARGASAFGGTWRNYWGLDSVGSGWYDNYTKSILEQTETVYRSEGDYDTHGQVAFTYDGQTFAVPLGCIGIGGRTYIINWNC